MARFAVAMLGVVGLVLTAAGLIAALAWGLPALGLNPNGRNPVDETIQGLRFAAILYVVGAALTASAVRWIRNHAQPQSLRAVVPVGGVFVGVFVVLSIWTAFLGYWLNIPILVFFLIGILAPMALGVSLWGNRADHRVRS